MFRKLINKHSDIVSCLKYLLYWPLFGLLFFYVERIHAVDSYYEVHCFLDDCIPFCEYFLVPYLFWFVYLTGTLLLTLIYDVRAFKLMMRFVMITYTISVIIYLLFPTCQNLRPSEFAHDNMFTRFITQFYSFDTNTNVCPSIHVIGSVAALIAGLYSKHIKSFLSKAIHITVSLLICVSTVFIKQHSVMDFFAAIPVCIVGYVLCTDFAAAKLQAVFKPKRKKSDAVHTDRL